MDAKYVDPISGRGAYRSAAADKPDMLFVSFDMVPREFYLPAAGDLAPRTPNIDRLRRDGVFFSNAYAASPLCSPSRAALFTGRYPYITANSERYHDGQEIHVRRDDTIYPEYLRAEGYRTRHYGKCHIGSAKFLDAFGENDSPWDRWSPPWYDDDGYREYLERRGVGGFEFYREIRGVSPSGNGGGNFMGGWVRAAGGGDFPRDATYPAYVTERALAGLPPAPAAGGGRKPLYIQVDYFEPHQPFFIPSGYEERERELRAALKESGLPGSWSSAAAGRPGLGAALPTVYSRYRAYWGLTDAVTAEDYLVAHALQYEILDEQIGRLLDALEERGTYDGTLVVLTADHGEMNCRDGLADKGAYLNPRVLQVPLYVKPPRGPDGAWAPNPAFAGLPAAGSVCGRLSSLLDLAPTMLAAAGIQVLDRLDGRPLGPAPESRSLLAEVFTHVVPNPAVSLIRQDGEDTALYTVNLADTADELYLRGAEGLWTERNGAELPERQELRRRCRRELLACAEGDARMHSYAAFLKLIFARELGSGADLQKFVHT